MDGAERCMAGTSEQMSNKDSGSCVHHWIIDTPNGAFSRGTCRKCRAVRGDFSNGFDSSRVLAYFQDRRPEMFIRATGISKSLGGSIRQKLAK